MFPKAKGELKQWQEELPLRLRASASGTFHSGLPVHEAEAPPPAEETGFPREPTRPLRPARRPRPAPVRGGAQRGAGRFDISRNGRHRCLAVVTKPVSFTVKQTKP